MGLSISLESVEMRKRPYWVCIYAVWSSCCDKAAVVPPLTVTWAGADTNPLLTQGPFHPLCLLPAGRICSPGQVSSLGAQLMVSTWAPAAPSTTPCPCRKWQADDGKPCTAEELCSIICFIFPKKMSLWVSALRCLFLPGSPQRGPQQGCDSGSGCLVWTELCNVLHLLVSSLWWWFTYWEDFLFSIFLQDWMRSQKS